MAKENFDALKAIALEKLNRYIEAEKNLWDEQGAFKGKEFYKNYKKAKSDFHTANDNWESALLEYAIMQIKI